MNNRALATLAMAIVLGLFTTPASAQKKAKEEHKSSNIPVASCDLYSKGTYLIGSFDSKKFDTTDRFTRKGLVLGTGCYLHNRSKFSLGLGAEFYLGNIHFEHEETILKGSFSYLETGFKQWIKAALALHRVHIGLGAGVQITRSSRFGLNSLQVNLGGDWFDLTEFGAEHLTSKGKLQIWEIGLDTSFPFNRNLSFTFGLLWQRYLVNAHFDFDMEAKEIFEALHYDINSVKQDFNQSVDFFYITPGAEWCGKNVCASLIVPWGVFVSKAWSWGSALEIKLKF